LSVIINNMQCIIDVDVINGYRRLGGGGQSPLTVKLDDSHVGHVLAMAPLSACSYHEWKTLASFTVPVYINHDWTKEQASA